MRRRLYRRYPWLRGARRKFITFALVLAVVPSLTDAANGWFKSDSGCAVWRVIDGDTLTMRCPEGFTRLRLVDIDTPELSAGCWGEAWRALAAKQVLRWSLLTATQINLPEDGPQDRYGRRLGAALTDGTPVSGDLLDAGLAVPYIPQDISWCARIERGEI